MLAAVFLAQDPAVPAATASSFNWAVVVASVSGSLVVAIFALVGIVFTQRNERAKAHADRIWEKRAEAYTATFKWSIGWQYAYMRVEIGDPDDEPPGIIPPDDQDVQLSMYGSPKVIKAYTTALKAHLAAVRADLQDTSQRATALALFRNLQTTIQRETHGKPDPRMRRGS